MSYLTLGWLITSALWSPGLLTVCESVGAAEQDEYLWLSWVCAHGAPHTQNQPSSPVSCTMLMAASVLYKLTSMLFMLFLFLLALPRRCERFPRAHVCGKNKQRLGVHAPLRWRFCKEASRYSSEAADAVDGHSGQVNSLLYFGEYAKSKELLSTKALETLIIWSVLPAGFSLTEPRQGCGGGCYCITQAIPGSWLPGEMECSC